MSESLVLGAHTREKVGSRHARKLRREGRIPCSIQSNDGKPHREVHIDEDAFLAARRHHVHLFDIDVDGETETALIRELQWDTFGDRIIHVEFKRVQRGVKAETEVELEFVGHPHGGVVQHILHHVTILALPSEIPDSLEVRVAALTEGDTVHASDVLLPEGVELVTDPETMVASISGARALIDEPTEAEEPTEGEAPGGETPEPPAE
jgi:large subunit ribosomal protein L25